MIFLRTFERYIPFVLDCPEAEIDEEFQDSKHRRLEDTVGSKHRRLGGGGDWTPHGAILS